MNPHMVADSPVALSCLSYNIHKGFTHDNREYVLDTIREAIRITECDLVGVQEVLGAHDGHAGRIDNWHPEAHFEFLADSVWEHYSYGKNAIYQEGHHGNAILSKYPFQSLFNHNISQWFFSQRGLLHGNIAIPNRGRHIHVACVHMGFLPYEQWRQCRWIVQWLEQLPSEDAVILMGDFNDWHHLIHRQLCRTGGLREAITEYHGKLQPTFPALKPVLALDRIYFKNLRLERSEVLQGQPWDRLSDHCPVFAKFLLD